MSHSYTTRTFSTPPETLPSSFRSRDDFDAFRDSLPAAAGEPGRLASVRGDTRSGWAIHTIANLLKGGDFPALGFLADDGQPYRFDGEHGETTRLSVIGPSEQARVVAQLEGLLSALKDDPRIAYDAEASGVYGEGDVEAALRRDHVSAMPAFDPQVAGDEGQSADYLFVFLRSVLEVLKNAQSDGLSVVHVLEY